MHTRRTSKRARGESSQGENSRTQGARQNVPTNPYGIIFRDDDQRDRYASLSQRRILNTRYMNFFALRDLGLLDDIRWMSERAGWGRFIEMKDATYTRLVLEFLSSVKLSTAGVDRYIAFRLMNQEFRLTFAEFNGIYGFPIDHDWINLNAFDTGAFLKWVTGHEDSTMKATHVHNPCFRYMQRFMAHTIFGRGDSDGVFRKDELFIIWAIMEGFGFDTGMSFMKHLAKQANQKKGDIVFGGLITPIATHLGLSCTNLAQATGSNSIDIDSCIAMHMVAKQDNHYFLCFRTNWRMPLPNPRTSVQHEINWVYPEVDAPEQQTAEAEDFDADLGPEYYHDYSGLRDDQGRPLTTTSSHGGAGPSGTAPTRDTSTIHATLARIEEEQATQRAMLQQIYDWHISQGHFGPPPS